MATDKKIRSDGRVFVQIRKIAWVHIRFSLPFLGPCNNWALIFTSVGCLQLHLTLRFTLKQHFNRLARVDCAKLGVVLKNLCRNFSSDLVLLVKMLLAESGRSIPLLLVLGGFNAGSLLL